MDKIMIVIETGNAAFHSDDEEGDHDPFTALEIARIVGTLCNMLRQGIRPEVLADKNGNGVGTVSYD